MKRILLIMLCCTLFPLSLWAQQESTDCEERIDDLIDFALLFSGIPYIERGSTPAGFDCSGFVCYVYSHFGITLPRHSGDQWKKGELVLLDDIKRGDLVFFVKIDPSEQQRIGHVGIVVSDYDEEQESFRFIHANASDGCVSISNFKTHFLHKYFGGARRISICP